jgi:hypothetical protein
MLNPNIKKSLLTTSLILAIFISLFQVNPAFAKIANSDDITSRMGTKDQGGNVQITNENAKLYENAIGNVANLPDISLEQAVGVAIKTVLRVSFYLTLIALIIISIYYIISTGKEENITKARNIILYLIIGMTIIAAAYGVTSGLSRFNFFSAEVQEDSIAEAEAAQ